MSSWSGFPSASGECSLCLDGLNVESDVCGIKKKQVSAHEQPLLLGASDLEARNSMAMVSSV